MSTTRAFSVLFTLLGGISLVCSILAVIHTHRQNVVFAKQLRHARGVGEGWIEVYHPPELTSDQIRKREADARQYASELERDRASLTLPYWIPSTIAVLSALVCASALVLWMKDSEGDANNTSEHIP